MPFPIKLPKVWPFKLTYTAKRQIAIIQKNEFKTCQPATSEVSEWLGFTRPQTKPLPTSGRICASALDQILMRFIIIGGHLYQIA